MTAIDVPALVAALAARGHTVAVAESLTGGLVTARLIDVPGASAVVRGGVIAYATELKASLLGVDAELLARVGAVDPEVARQMALGVRERLGATWGIATTGVAGPDPQDGQLPGTVYVAVASATEAVEALTLTGTRPEIRDSSVDAVLDLLSRRLSDRPHGTQ